MHQINSRNSEGMVISAVVVYTIAKNMMLRSIEGEGGKVLKFLVAIKNGPFRTI